jgi:hypothetical protein
MISFRFGPEDVANVRFAISPLMELHSSVRTLDHPEAKALHLPWVVATRERVADLAVLRDAGLADAHRVGRVVLYVRSPTGDALAGRLRDATARACPRSGSSAVSERTSTAAGEGRVPGVSGGGVRCLWE